MRQSRANDGARSNALWGRGSRGESRSNALWGRGGRRAGVAVTMVAVFALASVASAGVGGFGRQRGYDNLKSYVQDSLLAAIQQNPKQSFDVILQGQRRLGARGFMQKILQDKSGSSDENVQSGNVTKEFTSISGAELTLTGRQILRIARNGIADSIVPNETVKMSGTQLPLSNSQLWPWATGAPL